MAGMAIISEPAVEMTTAAETSESDLGLAVEETVREYSRFVFRLAYSILRNHDEAEDATQEVFMRVLKNRGKLAGIRDRKLWLARIAWRVALDWKSSAAKRRPAEHSDAILSELPSASQSPDQTLAAKQLSALLERAVATLPPDLRETLALSTVQELNSMEIASVLGIPEGSVRTRLMRARALLKQKLSVAMGAPE